MQRPICQVMLLAWLVSVGHLAIAQEPADQTDNEIADIKLAIQSYVTAFNSRDADKLISHWHPEGVYTSRTSGDQVVGQAAMAKEFATMFSSDTVPKLAVITDSIEFFSPNVALERGTATVTHSDGEITETEYRVVYVKQSGRWLIDRVTEVEKVSKPSHYENLKDLQWLVGQWTDQSGGSRIEFNCRWTEQQNFISRTYKVVSEDAVESSGLQIIGWDPQQKQVRSWLFDSNGVRVEGTWIPRDDRWTVQSVATLADGTSGSFTSVFRPLEDGSYGWKKINRVLDGKILPNIDEVVVRRK